MIRIPQKLTYKSSSLSVLTYIIVGVSLFVTFCSLNKRSFGAVCAALSLILIVSNFTEGNMMKWAPFAIVGAIATALLVLSGKMSLRGFNAPILHTLKFIYLMFTVSLAIGMDSLTRIQKKRVLQGVLISVLISTLISLYNVILVDKYAIRYYESRGFTTVFDFSQFYAICLLLCALFFAVISFRRKARIWPYVLLTGAIFACVGLSLYTTGILLSALGIGMAIAIRRYTVARNRVILWVTALAFLVILVYFFRQQISDWVYRITKPINWILRDRLRSVVDTILRTEHTLSYNHDRRDELAGYSLTSFRQHPLFGIGYAGYGYGTIGCHQEWQDMLGVFGLVGTGIFVALMVFLSVQVLRKTETRTDATAFVLVLLLFIALGFLNPCLSLPVLSVVFIIAPNISVLFDPQLVGGNIWDIRLLRRRDGIGPAYEKGGIERC